MHFSFEAHFFIWAMVVVVVVAEELEVPGIQAKNSLESKIGSSETREARWTRRGSTKDHQRPLQRR